MKYLLKSCSLTALFVLSLVSNAVFASSDTNWLPVGGGLNGVVNTIVIDKHSGNIYVGGSFTSAGGVAVNNMAMWNGWTWSALGSGMNGQVDALTLDSNGHLYAGGSFTSAGGVTANGVAEWNGRTWSAVGGNLSGPGNPLATGSNGHLYIGGICFGFEVLVGTMCVGSSSVMQIAEWDGSSWFDIGETSKGPLVSDSNGNLYTYGMNIPGGSTINGLAKWDGSSWSAVSSGLSQVSSNGTDPLTMGSDGNFYLGGQFSINSFDGLDNKIAKWDGTAWTELGLTFDGANMALATGNGGNLYTAGKFTEDAGPINIFTGQTRVIYNHVAKWNGTAWEPLGSGTNGNLFSLAVDGNDNVYVGGNFTSAGGKPIAYLAKWTGDANTKAKNDFDGDHASDVLFLNTTTGGSQYWKAAIKTQVIYPGAYDTMYTYAGTGDFNGDGKADIFFTRASNNGTLYWSGAVKTAATYPGTFDTGLVVAAICDTNGDGKDDLIWNNPATGGVSIWPSATKSLLTYLGSQGTAYTLAACADFDGDGKADLFWHNATTGANEIWLSANKATKTYPGLSGDLTWNVVGAGDIDGDGKADLVWYKASSGATMVWSSGLKSAATYPGTNATTFTPKAIGDYDGDGKADLLWGNDTTLGTQIWPGMVKSSLIYVGKYPAGFTIQK